METKQKTERDENFQRDPTNQPTQVDYNEPLANVKMGAQHQQYGNARSKTSHRNTQAE